MAALFHDHAHHNEHDRGLRPFNLFAATYLFVMTNPLKGTDLVACAKPNASQGLAIAAERCGYGQDTDAFMSELHQACEEMGVDLNDFQDLITEQQRVKRMGGLEIAPDSQGSL